MQTRLLSACVWGAVHGTKAFTPKSAVIGFFFSRQLKDDGKKMTDWMHKYVHRLLKTSIGWRWKWQTIISPLGKQCNLQLTDNTIFWLYKYYKNINNIKGINWWDSEVRWVMWMLFSFCTNNMLEKQLCSWHIQYMHAIHYSLCQTKSKVVFFMYVTQWEFVSSGRQLGYRLRQQKHILKSTTMINSFQALYKYCCRLSCLISASRSFLWQ